MVRRSGAWPIPWRRIDEDHEDPEWCEVVDANGDTIPFLGDLQYEVEQDQIKAVDALIAAVNSYPVLIAAARAVAEAWEDWERGRMDKTRFESRLNQMVRALDGLPRTAGG